MFNDINIVSLASDFAYAGRNPLEERKTFEKNKPKLIPYAKTVAFMMGYRGTNYFKITTKTVKIEKWLQALKELGIDTNEKAKHIKTATMYPEFILLGQCKANRYLISPFCQYVGICKAEWVLRVQVFMELTQQSEVNKKTFLQVCHTVWGGTQGFWNLFTDSEKDELKKAMIPALDYVITNTSGVSSEMEADEPLSTAMKDFLDKNPQYNNEHLEKAPKSRYAGFPSPFGEGRTPRAKASEGSPFIGSGASKMGPPDTS